MSRWRHIRVLSYCFPVRYRKGPLWKGAHGVFTNKDTIEIATGPNEHGALLHEAAHAVFRMTPLGKLWKEKHGEEAADELEEQVCEYIVPLLYKVILENEL